MKKAAVFLFWVALGSVVGTFVFSVLANRRSDRVIWQGCQPEGVHYGSLDPYCLSVVEGSIDWHLVPVKSKRRYYLFVGRGQETPGYGHYLDFSFTSGTEDPEAHIRGSRVEWSQEGLTFVAKSGHRLFVPKEAFIGGR